MNTGSEVMFEDRPRDLPERKRQNASDFCRALGVTPVAIGNLLEGQVSQSGNPEACYLEVSMDHFFGVERESVGRDLDEQTPETSTVGEFLEMTIQARSAAELLRFPSERDVAALKELVEKVVASIYSPVTGQPTGDRNGEFSRAGIPPEILKAELADQVGQMSSVGRSKRGKDECSHPDHRGQSLPGRLVELEDHLCPCDQLPLNLNP